MGDPDAAQRGAAVPEPGLGYLEDLGREDVGGGAAAARDGGGGGGQRARPFLAGAVGAAAAGERQPHRQEERAARPDAGRPRMAVPLARHPVRPLS
jgi:hypothetical protein